MRKPAGRCAGLGLGAAGAVSQQRKERCFIGRYKCLNIHQLRTKKICDSKPVLLEELVVYTV